MNSSLLRMLQSMKRIEDDPARHFQTKTIDLVTFVPKYPNVILVDQSLESSHFDNDDFPYTMSAVPIGGQIKYVFVTNTLSNAMSMPLDCGLGDPHDPNMADAELAMEMANGWTVILKEGLYMNPSTASNHNFILCHTSEFPGFEIVGLKDVRILFTEPSGAGAIIAAGRITFNNLRIYDFRAPSYGHVALKISSDTHEDKTEVAVDLIDVKIHSPTINGLFIDQSYASLQGCAITGCREGLTALGARVSLNSSAVTYNQLRGVVLHDGAEVSVSKSHFIGPNMVLSNGKCDVSISGSNFMHDRDPRYVYAGYDVTGVDCAVAFLISDGGSLTCNGGSTFRDYDEIAKAQGSNARVTITGCDMAGMMTVAGASENASLIVTDNVISSHFLIGSFANTKGRVEFLRNKLSDSSRPIMLSDRVSKEPVHDVRDVLFYHGTPRSQSSPNAKIKSKHTAAIKKKAQKEGQSFGDVDEFLSPKFKHCDRCLRREDSKALDSWLSGESAKPAEKFRYCGGCNRLCYCSKECQLAHWPDHRLACRSKEEYAEDLIDESRDALRVNLEMARRATGGEPISPEREEFLHHRVCAKCRKIEDHNAWLARIQGRGSTVEGKFGSCGRCAKVFYCSKECQRSHWPDHRSSCFSEAKKIFGEDAINANRDMMKVMIELVRQNSGGEPLSPKMEDFLYFRNCGKCKKIESKEAWSARIHARGARIGGIGGNFGCCGRCTKVFYCSKKCQSSHWPDHRAECKSLRSQQT